jgi:hypothetical protein
MKTILLLFAWILPLLAHGGDSIKLIKRPCDTLIGSISMGDKRAINLVYEIAANHQAFPSFAGSLFLGIHVPLEVADEIKADLEKAAKKRRINVFLKKGPFRKGE